MIGKRRTLRQRLPYGNRLATTAEPPLTVDRRFPDVKERPARLAKGHGCVLR